MRCTQFNFKLSKNKKRGKIKHIFRVCTILSVLETQF